MSIIEKRFLLLKKFIKERGLSPSLREMGELWEISHAAADGVVKRMEREGWVSFQRHNRRIIARTLEIIREEKDG